MVEKTHHKNTLSLAPVGTQCVHVQLSQAVVVGQRSNGRMGSEILPFIKRCINWGVWTWTISWNAYWAQVNLTWNVTNLYFTTMSCVGGNGHPLALSETVTFDNKFDEFGSAGYWKEITLLYCEEIQALAWLREALFAPCLFVELWIPLRQILGLL